MFPDVAQLLEIQEMDQEAHTLQEQLNQYPAIWDEMKKELRRKTVAVETLRNAEEERRKERVRIEQDLRLSSDKLKQYQAQQMMVKTGKELNAIGAQIETLKKTIARLEERGIALLEEDGQSADKIAKAEEELAEVKERARKERDRIRDQVAAKKERLTAVKADRDRAVTKVSEGSMKCYERVRARHPVNPVVSVRNGSCAGCNFQVLPHRLVEVHKGDQIIYCDNCGRILSEDESFSENEELA